MKTLLDTNYLSHSVTLQEQENHTTNTRHTKQQRDLVWRIKITTQWDETKVNMWLCLLIQQFADNETKLVTKIMMLTFWYQDVIICNKFYRVHPNPSKFIFEGLNLLSLQIRYIYNNVNIILELRETFVLDNMEL